MDDSFIDWSLSKEDEAASERLAAEYRAQEMFDPPLPGSLIAGRPLCRVPDSDVKYRSFLEWWFAVGRKATNLTTEDWGTVSGPNAARGCTEVIPKEDWEKLPESEREAIRRWAYDIPTVLFFD